MQQNTYQPEILAAIGREVAAVETEYKAALVVAAERLQAAQQQVSERSAKSAGRALVAEPPAEIDSETAVILHKLETRLDQLKELRDWIKIDPQLARFAAGLVAAPAPSAPPLLASSRRAGETASSARSRGLPPGGTFCLWKRRA